MLIPYYMYIDTCSGVFLQLNYVSIDKRFQLNSVITSTNISYSSNLFSGSWIRTDRVILIVICVYIALPISFLLICALRAVYHQYKRKGRPITPMSKQQLEYGGLISPTPAKHFSELNYTTKTPDFDTAYDCKMSHYLCESPHSSQYKTPILDFNASDQQPNEKYNYLRESTILTTRDLPCYMP